MGTLCLDYESSYTSCKSNALHFLISVRKYSAPPVSLSTFFTCSFGSKHVTPRTLTSRFLGNTVCLEGIVTKCEYLQII